MMKQLLFAIALSIVVTSVYAEDNAQPRDREVVQRMLGIALADRTNLLNSLTELQAKSEIVSEELAKARTRIDELENSSKPASEK